MKRKKDKKSRFRRTKAEIAAGLTFEQAMEARKNAPKKKTKEERRIERELKKRNKQIERDVEKEEKKIERERFKKRNARLKRIRYLENKVEKCEEAIRKSKTEIDQLRGGNHKPSENNRSVVQESADVFRTKINITVFISGDRIRISAKQEDSNATKNAIARLVYKDIYPSDPMRIFTLCTLFENSVKSIFYQS